MDGPEVTSRNALPFLLGAGKEMFRCSSIDGQLSISGNTACQKLRLRWTSREHSLKSNFIISGKRSSFYCPQIQSKREHDIQWRHIPPEFLSQSNKAKKKKKENEMDKIKANGWSEVSSRNALPFLLGRRNISHQLTDN
ncbi:hypothetical protein CEXT_171441 [Caerostris extrusa]|uniref:Uncharacterized protein n=1 Tax=Caerostris extrusa TaxID=172846 RepID=A0AAV4SXH9_CAEEX|nr:hypothetical protein CEXT_171441 [Caerostris extrusa]